MTTKPMTRRAGLKLAVGVIVSLVAEAGAAAPSGQKPQAAPVPLFDLLPDWSRSSAAMPMSAADLVNLMDAAIRFLKRNESGDLPALERELQDFADRYCRPGNAFDVGKASGLFLLMRVVFDLPDIVGANEAWNFGGWYAPEDTQALKDRREADDFHPAWPVYLARISNRLFVRSNANAASIGARPDYRVLEEYRFLRGKVRFRTASEIAGLEFVFVAAN